MNIDPLPLGFIGWTWIEQGGFAPTGTDLSRNPGQGINRLRFIQKPCFCTDDVYPYKNTVGPRQRYQTLHGRKSVRADRYFRADDESIRTKITVFNKTLSFTTLPVVVRVVQNDVPKTPNSVPFGFAPCISPDK